MEAPELKEFFSIRTNDDIKKVRVPEVKAELDYVFKAIKMSKKELNENVPLIGFAGSPWTLLCYAVQGRGSKDFNLAKEFCFSQSEYSKILLQKITETTISYLKEQVNSGVNAIQIFDSWGGLLSPIDYEVFSWKYIDQIIKELSPLIPVIVFGKGCWFHLNEMSKSKVSAIGIDWTCSARNARYLTGGKITLQGNLDPSKLLSPINEIKKSVKNMINEFGKDNYIVNLGHGILPNTPVDNAKAFIDSVKEYNSQ